MQMTRAVEMLLRQLTNTSTLNFTALLRLHSPVLDGVVHVMALVVASVTSHASPHTVMLMAPSSVLKPRPLTTID